PTACRQSRASKKPARFWPVRSAQSSHGRVRRALATTTATTALTTTTAWGRRSAIRLLISGATLDSFQRFSCLALILALVRRLGQHLEQDALLVHARHPADQALMVDLGEVRHRPA